jgi:hypothetical protein
MKKYRKKPVIIEAIQWDGTLSSLDEIQKCFKNIETSSCEISEQAVNSWSIKTLEGSHRVIPTDYIIKGIKGEFYPCKADIFEMTYEEVLEATGA